MYKNRQIPPDVDEEEELSVVLTSSPPIVYSRRNSGDSFNSGLTDSTQVLFDWLNDFMAVDDATALANHKIKEQARDLKLIMESNISIVAAILHTYKLCLKLSNTSAEETLASLEAYEAHLKPLAIEHDTSSNIIASLFVNLKKIKSYKIGLLEQLIDLYDHHKQMQSNAQRKILQISSLSKQDFKNFWREWPEFFPADFKSCGIQWYRSHKMLPTKLEYYVDAAKKELKETRPHNRVKHQPSII